MAKGPLDEFYKDCLRFGCLKCFRHFSLYLRGREELLVTIYHGEDGSPGPGTQAIGFGAKGLPPASPATRDPAINHPGETVFLIGAYARYNWPYVWLRSNSKLGDGADKDLPLDLNTTQHWKSKGYRVWDIVEELIIMNVLPTPRNPFALVPELIDHLPPLERSLMTGALALFYRDLLLRDSTSAYHQEVKKDLMTVLQRHFKDFNTVLEQAARLQLESGIEDGLLSIHSDSGPTPRGSLGM